MRPALDVLRLFLHVGSAAVWLGGMVVVAGLVPTLRRLDDDDATAKVMSAFARWAWPAYGLLILTGIWSILELPAMSGLGVDYQIALSLKILLAVASGLGAFVAQLPGAPPRAVPVARALATLSASGALLIGVGLLS